MPKCKKCGKQSSLFELDLCTEKCARCRELPVESSKPEHVSILDTTSIDASDYEITLKSIGMALMIGGVLIAFGFAFIYDPSVDMGDTKVNNFGKLSTQSNGVTICMGLSIIGSIFYVGGRLEPKK